MLAVSRCGLVSLVMSLSAMGLRDSGMHLASKFRASLGPYGGCLDMSLSAGACYGVGVSCF